ncbi:MAG: DUF2007 domain-containing protein [Candidatus Kapabacteria bacterium]|nr:DUF2007 domain-containing protein [Candidatus Kapabacteria bacterium]
MHSYGDNDWVTIATFNTVFDAQICCGLLRDNNVEVMIADEAIGSTFPIAVGGAKVRVKSSDVARAREILDSEMSED